MFGSKLPDSFSGRSGARLTGMPGVFEVENTVGGQEQIAAIVNCT